VEQQKVRIELFARHLQVQILVQASPAMALRILNTAGGISHVPIILSVRSGPFIGSKLSSERWLVDRGRVNGL